MINLEMFFCSRGMEMGFRRAGIEFDLSVDFERHHCDSYERNLGNRPEQLDVRVLFEQVRSLARSLDVDLLVARAGGWLMWASSSAVSAEEFRAIYHAEVMPPLRWIAALEEFLRRTSSSAQLRSLIEVDEACWRVHLDNQRRLALGGFLSRCEDGYRTTERGSRVLDDLLANGAG